MNKRSKYITLGIIAIISVSTVSIISISVQNYPEIKDSDILKLLAMQFCVDLAKSDYIVFINSNTAWSGSCTIEGFSGSGTGSRNFKGDALTCDLSFTMTAAGYLDVWALVNDKPVEFGTTSTIGRAISGHVNSPRLFNLLLPFILFPELFDDSITRKQNRFILIGIIVGIVLIFAILIITFKVKQTFKSHSPVYTNYRSYQFKRKKKYKSRPKISICPACKAPLPKKPPCQCEYCGRMLRT